MELIAMLIPVFMSSILHESVTLNLSSIAAGKLRSLASASTCYLFSLISDGYLVTEFFLYEPTFYN